jgi:hypothetical protein
MYTCEKSSLPHELCYFELLDFLNLSLFNIDNEQKILYIPMVPKGLSQLWLHLEVDIWIKLLVYMFIII